MDRITTETTTETTTDTTTYTTDLTTLQIPIAVSVSYLNWLLTEVCLPVSILVLSILQAVEIVVNDGDIGKGQWQDSASCMDGITTKTITEKTQEIAKAVSGSLLYFTWVRWTCMSTCFFLFLRQWKLWSMMARLSRCQTQQATWTGLSPSPPQRPPQR